MRTPTPNREYAALRRKWYEKLRKTGFHDIENEEHPDGLLSGRKEFSPTLTPEYYEWARRCLFAVHFRTRRHKKVWQLHADGKSLSKIALRVKLHKGTVQHLVRVMRSKFLKIVP